MTEILEAPTRARKPRASAARDMVEVTPLPQPFGFCVGRHLVVDNDSLAWPEADKGDILDIDFDVREYRGEGHYLLHHSPPPDEVVGPPGRWPFSSRWTEVQRIHRNSGFFERFQHEDGRGWTPIQPDEWGRIQVLGRVHGIYNRRGRCASPGMLEVGRVTAIGQGDGGAYVHLQPEPGRTIAIDGLLDWQVRLLSGLITKNIRLELKA